ncbi:MAG TPA: AI-2E family transporter [Leptolyngbyaceae cyanobacterium M33_DOE_097]|uniref:AI-2E family transporter n=1 Tax=Oscillatoriales cyanobacterium SpSt-418 TaxID=2282169 RepID=A0A7C3KHZ8_9CYAN|nr:AI-2E family transporter [Leptolyngbyaceae cyanobacterium M33_DOE_097]
MNDFFNSLNPWLRISLVLPLIVLNGWLFIQLFQYFEPLATIFVVATVLAFVLNYPVQFLQKRRLNRSWAILLVLVATLIGLLALVITLLPTLFDQVSAIADQLPNWLFAVEQKLQVVQNWATAHGLPINLMHLTEQTAEQLPNELEKLGDETILLTINAVGGLSSILLTFVLTFYFLIDGKRVWEVLFQWLPQPQRERVLRSLQSDFHSYLIGQVTLSLLMGSVFTALLVILGAPYSFVLGFTVGVMTLIPFGDVLGYILVCLLLAAHSPSLALITLVSAIIIDQIIDQAIAPRILGSFTGLKPVWVIIALLLGTKLFGFAGLLTAVPLASFINTLLDKDETPLPQKSNEQSDADRSLAETLS